MNRVRVLVVDDSAFARKVIRESLSAHRDIEVVGIARDGLEALECISELSPDVVTLDLMMPNLDGLGLLEALDPPNAPRVVVVSTSASDSEIVLLALDAGAVDFVHKPTALATDRLYEISAELRAKVLAAAGARPVRSSGAVARVSVPPAPARAGRVQIVVVGTSTGGPQALSRLLRSLPGDFPAPMAAALHIPEGYTDTLARRLGEESLLRVVEADGTLELRPGLVVLARGGAHLVVAREAGVEVARVERSDLGTPFVPSVDHLFRSAVATFGGGVLGVVLTGMGDDGLEGARAIRDGGGQVLVESASSCVVDGMPKSVRAAGLANAEAPLEHMAALVASRL